MYTRFTQELEALLAKHKIILSGNLVIVEKGNNQAVNYVDSTRVYGHSMPTFDKRPQIIFDYTAIVEKFIPVKPQQAAMVSSDYPAYDCPVTGQMIDGRKEHRENLKKTGCRLLEKGEHEHNQKRKAEDWNNFEKKVEKTIHQKAEGLNYDWRN
jgi:hypothetical protein